jgi:hypothetical protein
MLSAWSIVKQFKTWKQKRQSIHLTISSDALANIQLTNSSLAGPPGPNTKSEETAEFFRRLEMENKHSLKLIDALKN